MLSPRLVEWTQQRPDVAVVKVDIDRPFSKSIDFQSPLAKQYDIHALPAFQIYDQSKKLIADGDPAGDEVISNIQHDLGLK